MVIIFSYNNNKNFNLFKKISNNATNLLSKKKLFFSKNLQYIQKSTQEKEIKSFITRSKYKIK